VDRFSCSDLPDKKVIPVARAGFPLIFVSVFTTILFALWGFAILSLIGLVVTLCFCGFFRDPERNIPDNDGAVVSPADGKIIVADTVTDNRFFQGPCKKVSVFMSVFNVHVNRIPYEGTVKQVQYHPGEFFFAHLDKASEKNEHNIIFLETEEGKRMGVIQIAGLVARRIICNLKVGDKVTRGSRFGIICFGSRLDVYLPAEIKLGVSVGDKVKAGSSVLGYLP
jgi:phosphatidylserine decarboxylase